MAFALPTSCLSRAPPTSESEEEAPSKAPTADSDWLRFFAFLYVFGLSSSRSAKLIKNKRVFDQK
jgi:hypothetical protein